MRKWENDTDSINSETKATIKRSEWGIQSFFIEEHQSQNVL